jgi:hypothetical protein
MRYNWPPTLQFSGHIVSSLRIGHAAHRGTEMIQNEATLDQWMELSS